MLTLDMVREAQEALQGIARRTPLDPAPRLGENIYIKAENLQLTGAFKLRGAYNKIRSLTPEEAKRGLLRREPCPGHCPVGVPAGHQVRDLYARGGAHQKGGGHPQLWRRGSAGPRRLR